jgi:putative membrane protein
MTDRPETARPDTFHPRAIERPTPVLMKYYLIVSLPSFCAWPVVILPLIARYITLRYRFDDEGIFMSWGLLFRRETNLTYRRIQDIHLTRNLLERWMGLAKVKIQTAAGSGSPIMTIEGVMQAAELRDFLYTKMRGAKAGSGRTRG